MKRDFIKTGFAAGLGLLALCAAAPLALADAPGSYFQDGDQRPAVTASVGIDRTQTDGQIEAVSRKADQALATAQQALREAEQTTRTTNMAALLPPAQLGGMTK
jgi:GGDEF domain-containing protein